ncbi:hypothetical protein SCLCIDRAFT_1212706 [Scleroderma citrinum Foug A]|uniref:Uncharacterized protein n=1 Tax=Scleroderma citrinum Foug A TaxID=1036808 RepID=A0A0C3E9I6_9AGAM|nr:hypothetical protein SCLCIDRAFT_1212706 [Scleroderma citrinum Foug A]
MPLTQQSANVREKGSHGADWNSPTLSGFERITYLSNWDETNYSVAFKCSGAQRRCLAINHGHEWTQRHPVIRAYQVNYYEAYAGSHSYRDKIMQYSRHCSSQFGVIVVVKASKCRSHDTEFGELSDWRQNGQPF